MGEKRKRQRQYFLPLFALCLIYVLMLAGCQVMVRKTPVVSNDTAATEPLPQDSFDEKKPDLEQQTVDCPLLDRAESHVDSGNYHLAMDDVTRAVATCGDGDDSVANRALILMIRAMAHVETPENDVHTIMAHFGDLESPLPEQGPAARCWLAVLDELMALSAETKALKSVTAFQRNRIEALKHQIEELKAVDLELGNPEPEMDDAYHE